jgi:hypothetical protein
MNNQIAICTVAFGDRYVQQQDRMLATLPKNVSVFKWTNSYPPTSLTMEESLYGFKVHAINHAFEMGWRQIIWLDTACIIKGSLDYLFAPEMPAVVAVKDDTPLLRTISDRAIQYYGGIPDDWHLVGGSLYAFDFNKDGCAQVFKHWAKAEGDGIFGNMKQMVSEQINRHRHDESCMAVAMYSNGILPVTHEIARYRTTNGVIEKDHFK